jgi:lipopolysaccharide transport system ATP-binding protein
VIKIQNLTKKYIGFNSPFERILTAISFGLIPGSRSYTALSEITLRVNAGEILGIIGRNGAGKSTLLKVLSGVSKFQSGNLEKIGSIRSILELGVGFNPELSGAENIYYNGLVWGYSVQEIQVLSDSIFEFSGLNEFRNVPLKNYSTGMMMRLGFALATANRPDILLVDEALAVGDASFQQKSLSRFQKFKEEGSAIVIVSHDLNLLQMISDRMIVMEKGKIEFDGLPSLALKKYIQILADNSFAESLNEKSIDSVFIESYLISICGGGISKSIFGIGEVVTLSFTIKIKAAIPDLTIGFHIDDARGLRVFGTNSYHLKKDLKNLKAGSILDLKFTFPLNISHGKYNLGFALHKGDNHTTNCYLWKDDVLDFEVERLGVPKFDGPSFLPVECEWEIKE